MEENRLNKLKDKVNALGADTIMGTMAQGSAEDALERLDKLNDAVAEHNNTDVENVAVTGSNPLLRGYLPKTRPVVRDTKKIGRNDPCPCGSGKKYKNCCLASGKYETTHFE
jgi:uncharacterized protein YecA (UPF0149 family)